MRQRPAVIANAQREFWPTLLGFVRFLNNPVLVPGTEARSSRTTSLFWLLAFSFAVTAAFAAVMAPLIWTTNERAGEHLQVMHDRPWLPAVVALVILGPLIEEVLFRGWLPGTIRAFVGTAAFAVIIFAGAPIIRILVPEFTGLGTQLALAITAVLAFAALQRGAGATPIHPYVRAFPVIFWCQGIAFGAMHYANASFDSVLLRCLAVMPLICCGWLWGYARMVFGFRAAWLLHMAYNVPVTVVMMAAKAWNSG